jgi:putative ABC transport system permease protein
MNPIVTTRVALRALLRNKLRSLLTVLGMVIGVGAVIAMVAIGEGASQRVRATFDAMGTNMLVITSGSGSSKGSRGGAGSSPSLTWKDLDAIKTDASAVAHVAPQLQTRGQLVAEDSNWNTQIVGTTPEYFDIRSWAIAAGDRFSATDASSKVIVLGNTVAAQLYGDADAALGHTVRVSGVPFVIIGVAARKGQSPVGQDYDDTAWVPVKTFQSKLSGSQGNFIPGVIYVSATSADSVARAERQVSALLAERHHGAEDFTIRNLSEIAAAQEESTSTFTSLLAAIAAVSLLVGGIGIMNIMLVSVTERTREIGIRMAIGARPGNILMQFLVEAMALAAVGGLVGVVSGIFAARELGAHMGWSTVVRPEIAIIAVVFSAVVGIGFGLFPARKASRLDPITALRFE